MRSSVSGRGERTRKAVRDGAIKYIALFDGDRCEEYLFDLQADPAERVNLIDRRPETASRLKELLRRGEQQVKPSR